LFDIIGFVNDSFHLACQANEKFLKIQQKNNITPIGNMGCWVQVLNWLNSERTNHSNVIDERLNESRLHH
jgi:hypothetical protein